MLFSAKMNYRLAGLFNISSVLNINKTISSSPHCWYLILLTSNIRHVSKCSSPNWPLITFAEHTDVWGVWQTYLSWGCHVCSVLLPQPKVSHIHFLGFCIFHVLPGLNVFLLCNLPFTMFHPLHAPNGNVYTDEGRQVWEAKKTPQGTRMKVQMWKKL